MVQTPLVSIIICVYNAGRFLRESVLSAIEQTYKHFELIIINDGSTDGCIDTIREIHDPRIRIFHQENKGKPSAMNLALENARGEFYAVQDADDLSAPNRIERQLEYMLRDPDLAASFCGYDIIIDGKRIAPLSRGKERAACLRDILAFRIPCLDPTGMYRMSLVQGERYNPAFPVVEGIDYILRIGEKFPMVVIGGCLYSYRIHGSSITRQNIDRRHKLLEEVLRSATARRGVAFSQVFPHFSELSSKHTNRDADNNLAAHFIESACELVESGNRFPAISVGLKCVSLHPMDLHYYKAMIYALSPTWVLTRRSNARSGTTSQAKTRSV